MLYIELTVFGAVTSFLRLEGVASGCAAEKEQRVVGMISRSPTRPSSAGTRRQAGRNQPSDASETSMGTWSGSESDTSGTSSMSVILEEEDWFHGLLPKEDCVNMLKKNGEFLVRVTEINRQEKTIITAQWDGQPKHFAIQKTRENKFYIENRLFLSISDMIRFYMASKEPLTMKSGVQLQKPVIRQSWELTHEQIRKGKKIGEGAFGLVYEGELMKDNKRIPIAVKLCSGHINAEERATFMQEAKIMRQYNHKNIVRLIGVAVQKDPIMLVLELVPGGSLLDYLRKNRHSNKLKNTDRVRFCLDPAEGMEYLEQRRCIHRDLATRNCLMGKNNIVKLTDFGLSTTAAIMKGGGGKKVPTRWLAPETLTKGTYTTKTDRWSFGVLMWEVFSGGKEPYQGMSIFEVQKKVGSQSHRMTIPSGTPTDVERLIKRCWEQDPDKRPTFSSLKNELDRILRSKLL